MHAFSHTFQAQNLTKRHVLSVLQAQNFTKRHLLSHMITNAGICGHLQTIRKLKHLQFHPSIWKEKNMSCQIHKNDPIN